MNDRPSVRIGNGCGFYGDQLDAPRDLVRSGNLDYLTLEYLAELTLSILARRREKDPSRGYAHDFLYVVESLVPDLSKPNAPKIITNAGGMNPPSCARAVADMLCAAELADRRIAVVTGDDILSHVDSWLDDGEPLEHLDTGRPLTEVRERLVSANAYLGAAPIVEALRQGAEIVITGRVADASLTVAPARFAFGWSDEDTRQLAQATLAGHLIECGAQATGGYSTSWESLQLADVGYPIAVLDANGGLRITKPAGTGGAVTARTITEQLLYEVGDPSAYLTPDLILDVTGVTLEEIEPDVVAVRGAETRGIPQRYKVSAAYRAGYQTSGQLVVYGEDCLRKADAIAGMVVERVRRAGFKLERFHVEKLGSGDAVPLPSDRAAVPTGLREVVLRIAVADSDRRAVERFSRELAPLVTSGPAGIGGYTQARQPVRPVYAFWPATVAKSRVDPLVRIDVRPAAQWASSQKHESGSTDSSP